MRHRLAFVSAAGCLLTAGPAAAQPPQHSADSFAQKAPVPNFLCADGSIVYSTFTVERRVTTTFDPAGIPLRETRQIRYAGELSSEDGARTIPYAGRTHRVFDFGTLTITITGRGAYSSLSGASTTGRRVIDIDADQIVSESGRPASAFEQPVCAYLYPAS